jgi:hypothetical protein
MEDYCRGAMAKKRGMLVLEQSETQLHVTALAFSS